MIEKSRKIRLEEVAGYFTSQSRLLTNSQLVEALQKAHQQFLDAVAAVPESLTRAVPLAGEWSILDVLLHMRTMAVSDLSSLKSVLVYGKKPVDAHDVLTLTPPEMTRSLLLADLEDARTQLSALVLSAPADAHLDLTWSHPIFGAMHWREWLVFTRVHTLDHMRQVQTIAAALALE